VFGTSLLLLVLGWFAGGAAWASPSARSGSASRVRLVGEKPSVRQGRQHRSHAARRHGRYRELCVRLLVRRSSSQGHSSRQYRVRRARGAHARYVEYCVMLKVSRRTRRQPPRRTHKKKPGKRTTTVESQQPAARPAGGELLSGTACVGAEIMPAADNLAAARAATLCLIDRERAVQGEAPLQANADLERAAQGHAESMATAGYFEHTGPGGNSVLERFEQAGYIEGSSTAYEIGENIAWGSLQDATPASVVAAWMASPGHRANILNPDFRDTGIGIAPHLPSSFGVGAVGAMYAQDFGVVM
jgi:uncharacterized protein YkwD